MKRAGFSDFSAQFRRPLPWRRLLALHTPSSAWSYGLEAYGTVDRMGGSGNPSEAQGPIVYYTQQPGPSGRWKAERMALEPRAKGDDDEAQNASMTIRLGFSPLSMRTRRTAR
jgi:hypothetical protein